MTTTDEAPEVWRVECEGGETREVEVVDVPHHVLWLARAAGDAAASGGWCPRVAVATLAASRRWPAVAVLAPGQPTRAEAEAERDALRSLLAAAARGELPRCDECQRAATLYAATTAGEFFRCDEHAGGDEWEALPHAAALRAAMGGAK